MLTIKYTKRFKKDYEREKSGRYSSKLKSLLAEVTDIMTSGKDFPHRYFDHSLSGEWKDCRNCHLKPDLILIYRKINNQEIELLRLGSHSELGL